GIQAQPDIDRCFNFLRGAEYTFPQILRALNDVIDALLGPGAVDYRVYAQQMQNLFLAEGARSLDEYGVPIPIIQKLHLTVSENIQDILDDLRNPQSGSRRDLSPFESEILARGVSLD